MFIVGSQTCLLFGVRKRGKCSLVICANLASTLYSISFLPQIMLKLAVYQAQQEIKFAVVGSLYFLINRLCKTTVPINSGVKIC